MSNAVNPCEQAAAKPPQDGMPLLELRDICKRYGPVEALRHLDFPDQPLRGGWAAGDNGAGKSTLIKMMSGVVSPTAA